MWRTREGKKVIDAVGDYFLAFSCSADLCGPGCYSVTPSTHVSNCNGDFAQNPIMLHMTSAEIPNVSNPIYLMPCCRCSRQVSWPSRIRFPSILGAYSEISFSESAMVPSYLILVPKRHLFHQIWGSYCILKNEGILRMIHMVAASPSLGGCQVPLCWCSICSVHLLSGCAGSPLPFCNSPVGSCSRKGAEIWPIGGCDSRARGACSLCSLQHP